MIREDLNNKKLDKIMHNALVSNSDLIIPSYLSDRTIRLIEKKALLKQLTLELCYKVLLVLLSLALFAGVFVIINGTGYIVNLINFISNNLPLFTSVLILVSITILIDQVVLRFYTTFNKQVNI